MIDRYAIADAAERLAPYIRRTPVIRLSEGEFEGVGELTLKLELLQHTGSFKPRGAFNRVLAADIPDAGLIAASGGNHGAAVAFVARRLDVPAEIFIPEITGRAKRERITGYGARLIEAGATYADALAVSRRRQAETGALEVHAYDHPAVLAGQGTIGHELSEQAPELTHLLVAVGGGGLIGGIAAWYGGRVHLVAVEPAACPCLYEARRVGHPVDAAVGGVAADSLGARQVGGLAFSLASSFVQGIGAREGRRDRGCAALVVGPAAPDRRARRRDGARRFALGRVHPAARRAGRRAALRRQRRPARDRRLIARIALESAVIADRRPSRYQSSMAWNGVASGSRQGAALLAGGRGDGGHRYSIAVPVLEF